MSKYRNGKEVMERATELRRSHSQLRAEICIRQAMGMSYANGRHWMSAGRVAPNGGLTVDVWKEQWSPQSREMRVTDNKIGPLVRRVSASTNATRIEASCKQPRHMPGIEYQKMANTAQNVLNGCELDMGCTIAARNASSVRWMAGSALILLKLSQKQQRIDDHAMRHPDGSPVEVNDQWVRWEEAPLTDLIWDPANLSKDLERHNVLMLEQALTVRKFEQEYGPLDRFGIKKESLPKMGQIAPHYIAAAGVSGTSLFAQYAQNSNEPALRVMKLMETDPADPTRWTECYTIIDTSTNAAADIVNGIVLESENLIGWHGRPIFKLDAYWRNDSVWSYGIPHATMGQQDMLNIAKSIQFQQMTAVVNGMWLLDKQTADVDEFTGLLTQGVGGVLVWDSKNQPTTKPPAWIHPQPMDQGYTIIGADLSMGMRDAVHLTSSNMGNVKSHVPVEVQKLALEEGNIVIDNIIRADADVYSDALMATIGTIRNVLEGPSRMIQRLQERIGFNASDLETMWSINPMAPQMTVRVREASIISRSVDERSAQMQRAIELQAMTPQQYAIACVEELERPLQQIDEKQFNFLQSTAIKIINGLEWPGMPSLGFEMFRHVMQTAIFGLEFGSPEAIDTIARLERAISVQHRLAVEQGALANMPPQATPPQSGQIGGESLLPDMRGGSPGSIDPSMSPVGASGGLPLGLV